MIEKFFTQEELAELEERRRQIALVEAWRQSDAMEEMEPGGAADKSLELAAIIGELGLGVQSISEGTTPMGNDLSLRQKLIVMLLQDELDEPMAKRVDDATRGQYIIIDIPNAA